MAKFEKEKVINALHPEKAKVGEKYWYSDNIFTLKEKVENNKPHATLKDFTRIYFEVDKSEGLTDKYYLLYPYEEPPKQRMTKRQFAEWLAKGNGLMKYDNPVCSISISYIERQLEEEVDSTVLIKPWDSEEWVEPTVDIYERDCKGGKK